MTSEWEDVGRERGWWRLWVILSVLWRPSQGFLENVSSCSMQALSVIDCYFLLGGEPTPLPVLVYIIVFWGFVKCKKSLWCFFSPISLLPLQPIRLLMLLVFRDLWEALIGEPNIKRLWRKSELPRTKQEEPGISMTQTQVVEHLSRFLWKLFFYLKRRRWSTDCWDMF